MICFFFWGGVAVQPLGTMNIGRDCPPKAHGHLVNQPSIFRDYVRLSYTSMPWDSWDVQYQSSRITWVFINKSMKFCLQHIVMMIPDVEFTRYPKTSWPRDPAQPLPNPLRPFARTVENRHFSTAQNGAKTSRDAPSYRKWVPTDPEGSKSPICVLFKFLSDFSSVSFLKDSGKKHAWIFRGGNVVSFSFFSTKDMLWVRYLFSGLSSWLVSEKATWRIIQLVSG